MSLMLLSPESQRLRRVAKAYAAGEMSLQAYRDIRAEVLHSFESPGSLALDEDATEQRHRVQKHRSEANPSTQRPAVMRWVLISIAVVTLGLVVAGRDALALEIIPAVNERDPNPATSMRLDIDGFYVENFHELEGLTLSLEQVNVFLANQLSMLEKEIEVKTHGFTERELAELATFLQGLSVHERKAGISVSEGEALVALVQSQKNRRGPSLVQLEQVANNLAKFYRENGMPISVAYVPAQSVDQRVAFTVLPGKLEQVSFGGADQSNSGLFEKQFSSLLGQTVQAGEIESALFLINDLPGLDVQANFVAGESLGGTRLNLIMNKSRTWTAELGLDNHGDKQTGLQRTIAVGNWNNPASRGDRLKAGILHSWNSGNSDRGYLDYQIPVFNLATTLNLGLSNSGFGFEDISPQIGNGSRIMRVAVQHVMQRSRSRSWNLQLGNSIQSLKIKSPGINGDETQKLWYFLGALEANLVSDVYRTRSNFRLELDLGNISSGALVGQDKSFWRARFNGELEKLLVLPGLPGQQELRLSLVAQLSDRSLPASLELGLAGGESRVGGFYRSDFSADSGLFLGSELRLFPERQQIGTFVLMADVAFGKHYTAATHDNAGISSVGLGWDVSMLQGLLNGKLRWSFPVSSNSSIRNRGSRLLWSMEYRIK